MAGTHEDPRYFAHERLDAYELALAAVRFVADRRHKLRGLPGQAGDQLERAVVGAQTAVCSAAAGSREEYETVRETLLRLCACLYRLAHR
ncbi:MAG TPA: hypothetical protein VKN99_13085 [Polyangia bacterium]|nr:hypothetical protein [Polyangia bacterium]